MRGSVTGADRRSYKRMKAKYCHYYSDVNFENSSDTTLHTLSSPCATSSPVLAICYQASSQLSTIGCTTSTDRIRADPTSTVMCPFDVTRPTARHLVASTISEIEYHLANWILSLESDIISQTGSYRRNSILSRILSRISSRRISPSLDKQVYIEALRPHL
jgi:hypothetical protein